MTTTTTGGMKDDMPPGSMPGMTNLAPGANGTRASAGGLTLKPATTTLPAGNTSVWKIQVVDTKGMPVTRFQRDQTKLMHLIVVRDDLAVYQHLHPALSANGTFTVPLFLPTPGRYRAVADFTTGGTRYALGVNLVAPGKPAAIVPLPAARRTTTVDGYTVSLGHAMLMGGHEAPLTFTVTKAGKPETALQTYLGAYGHLVAFRTPDLAYAHIHPVAHDAMAGTITFEAEFPTAATYRLFLQFRADGKVNTAAFTVVRMS
jgi:hypothetical protein